MTSTHSFSDLPGIDSLIRQLASVELQLYSSGPGNLSIADGHNMQQALIDQFVSRSNTNPSLHPALREYISSRLRNHLTNQGTGHFNVTGYANPCLPPIPYYPAGAFGGPSFQMAANGMFPYPGFNPFPAAMFGGAMPGSNPHVHANGAPIPANGAPIPENRAPIPNNRAPIPGNRNQAPTGREAREQMNPNPPPQGNNVSSGSSHQESISSLGVPREIQIAPQRERNNRNSQAQQRQEPAARAAVPANSSNNSQTTSNSSDHRRRIRYTNVQEFQMTACNFNEAAQLFGEKFFCSVSRKEASLHKKPGQPLR